MNNIIKFLDTHYHAAIELSDDFSKTREQEWTPLLILNELSIQIGHVYNIIYHNTVVNETNRIFNDLGDELSDVFLQLLALADSLHINIYHIKNEEYVEENNWLSLPILIGQLNEAIMEKFGYRFKKPRIGFRNIDDFIENKILKLILILYQISLKYQLDIEKEFAKMLEDANTFLEKNTQIKQNRIKREYRKIWNKMYFTYWIDKKKQKKKYILDESRIENKQELEKEEIRYSVILLNTGKVEEPFFVYLLIAINDKILPFQLLKKYRDKKMAQAYEKKLFIFIKQHNNKDILSLCWQKKKTERKKTEKKQIF